VVCKNRRYKETVKSSHLNFDLRISSTVLTVVPKKKLFFKIYAVNSFSHYMTRKSKLDKVLKKILIFRIWSSRFWFM